MFRQRAAEVACFAFIAAVGVQLVASQTVTCYNSSTTCTSTSVSLTGTRPAGQCCLNRGGRSYRVGTSTTCTPCVVYGFFQSPNSTAPSTTVYQKEGSQLTGYFGFVNGTFSGTHSVSFSVPDNNRYIKSFTTGVLNSAAARQQFTLNIIPDNIALQPPLMVPVSATVDGSSEFVLPFNATILDADVVTIGFRESDYSVTEGASPPDQYPKIKLAKDKTIAQRLSIQVVPLTVDQFRPLGIPLPDGITFADLTNPAQYIPNGPMDFDKSILNLTFTSSQNELSPNVGIVDDQTNEAEQQFICIVRLADPSVNASGNVIIKTPSTVIRIVDNDPIAIGFGADTYTFTKGMQRYYPDTVKLVKDEGVVSEQTFSVTVIAQPNAVANQAIYDKDYDIGPLSEQTFTITPDQQSVSIGVNIYDAGLTGTLQAKLVSTQANTPSYSPPHNPTTLLLILDNTVAIVGFVDRGAVVTEGEDFIECVAVTNPSSDLDIRLSFYVMVKLVPDTADASDVFISSDPIILGPFDNTNRKYCFSTTALADEYFEGNQTFTYSLTLVEIEQQASVMISPNVTMVTILDNTTLTIGFDPTQYAVNKSDSYVTFGVSILGGATIQGASVGVKFSTGDGTALAGQDYNQTAQLLSFNENTAYIPVAVGIINNGYYEDDISFQANLALQSAGGYEQFVTLRPAMATATIIDDINGVTIGFNQTGYSFLENQRYARVSVRVLQGRLKKSVAVQFRTIRGSAVGPDDYTETDKILVFNESTLSINVDVPVVDDGLAEDDESFSAQLLAVSPSGLVTIAPATTLITIIDTNSVIIGFEKQSYQISKHQNQGRLPVKIQVLQGTLGRTVLLHVKTRDGSAIASTNYISIDSDLPAMNFSAHELTVDVSIVVNDLAEDDKVFSVELSLISPSSRVTIAPISAQVTIIDDNSVTIGFEHGSYQISKHQNQGRLPVKIQVLQGTLGRTVLLRVKTRDGSAIASTNYISIDSDLPAMNFSVHELTVDVSIIVNDLAEDDKVFSVELSLISPSSRVTIAPISTQVTIIDDNNVTIGFEHGSYQISKHQNQGRLPVKIQVLQGRLGRTVLLRVKTRDGSAIASTNYISIDSDLPALNVSIHELTVDVSIVVNDLAEDDKVFSVELSLISPSSRVTIAPISAQVTIIDDNNVTIGFEHGSYQISKHQNQGRLPVKIQVLQGRLGRTVLLRVKTRDGSAIASTNYISIDSDLPAMNFSVHELTVDVSIVVNDLAEDDKVFSVELSLISPTSRVTIAPISAQVTIIDDNSVTIGFEHGSYQISKHQNQGRLPVKIQVLQGTLGRTVLLRVKTRDGSAIASTNYISIDADLPALNFSVHELTVDVSIIVNDLAEDDKVFSVELSLISPSSRVTIAPISAQVTIIDDNNVTIGFEHGSYQISKHQNQGRLPVKIQVLQGRLGRTVLLRVKTRDGSAIASTNYISIDSDLPALNISVHELTVDVSIVVNDLAEDDKVFSVELSLISPSSRVTIAPISAQVTIIDDNNVTIGFEHGSYQISKHQNQGRLPVKIQVLQGTLGRTVLLRVKTRDGSAIASTNYLSIDADLPALNFSVHELTVDVSIVVNDLAEDDKVFSVELSLISPSSRVTIAPISAQVTIIDDNNVTIGFEHGSYQISKHQNQGRLPVKIQVLQGTLGRTVLLRVKTRDGSAIASTNYISIDSDLPALNVSVHELTVDVSIVVNDLAEDDKVFSVELSLISPSSRVTIAPISAQVTIIDDNNVTIGFEHGSYQISKHQNQGRLPVKIQVLQGRLGRTVLLRVKTRDGSAIASTNYISIDSDLPALNVSVHELTVDVSIVVNDLAEDDKVFSVELSLISPSSRVTIAPISTQVTIIDDNNVTIGFEHGSYQISKHQNQGRLPVKIQVLQGTLGRTVLLRVKTRDGSAIASTNYISIDSDLPALNVSVHKLTVDVSIVVNDLAEDDKVFSVELSLISPSSRVTIAPISAQVTIIDDNNVTIGFEHGSYQISKHQNQGRLPVKIQVLQGRLGRTVLLRVKTRDGSAIASTNYISIDADLPALNVSVHELTVDVSIVVNELAEDDKVFSVELSLISPTSRVTIAPISAQVTIIDDNSVIFGFEQLSYSISESNTYVTLKVKVLQGMLGRPVTLYLSTADVSATAAVDYTPFNNYPLVFGQSVAEVTLNVPIVMDNLVEYNETFRATLSLPIPSNLFSITPSSAIVTIVDDDTANCGFNETFYDVYVTDRIVQIQISVTSGVLGRPVQLLFATRQESAIAGIDYDSVTSTVTFDPTHTSQYVNVPITNKGVYQSSSKSFDITLTLTDPIPNGFTVDPDTATVTIEDNHNITIGFVQTNFTVRQSAGNVTLAVMLLGGSLGQNISINVDTIGDASTVGRYVPISGRSLEFSPTSLTQYITVLINNDGTVRPDATFSVQLSSTLPRATLAPSKADVTILNDNSVTIGLERASYVVYENVSVLSVTVILDGKLQRPVTVAFRTSDGTATAPTDYSPVSKDLTFTSNVNNSAITVDIPIIYNPTEERSETFFVILGATDPSIHLSISQAVATILDTNVVTVKFSQPTGMVLQTLGYGTLCITKTGSIDRNISVKVSGALQPGLGSLDRTLVIAPNDNITCVNFTVVNDRTALKDVILLNFTVELVDKSDPNVVVEDPSDAVLALVDDEELGVTLQNGTTVHESNGTITSCVTFDKVFARSFNINVVFNGLTATAGDDFTPVRLTLVAMPGDSQQCFTFQVKKDNTVEQLESLDIVISIAPDPELSLVKILNDRATYFIIDDDTLTIGFERSAYSVNEGASVVLAVSIHSNTVLERPVTVAFDTTDGTATAGIDYTAQTGYNLVFTNSTRTILVTVVTLNNGVVEGLQAFQVALRSVDQAVIFDQPIAEVVIADVDRITFGFEPSSYAVSESDRRVAVTLVIVGGTLQRDLTVTVQTNPGTASASRDYTPLTRTLTFSSAVPNVTFIIDILADNTVEDTQNFSVVMLASDPAVTNTGLSSTIDILDSDVATIGFDQAVYPVGGDASYVSLSVSIHSDVKLERSVKVLLNTHDQNATSGRDYGALVGLELEFDNHTDFLTVPINIIDNGVVEGLQAFQVALSSVDQAVKFDQPTAEVVIADVDKITLDFVPTVYNVRESDGRVNVTVAITNGTLKRDVTVTVKTFPGTATESTDYTPLTRTLTLSASVASITFTIDVLDDNRIEVTETFAVVLQTSDPAVSNNSASSASIRMFDTTQATFGFRSSQYTVAKGSPLMVLIAMSTPNIYLDRPVTVTIQSFDNTALASKNYVSVGPLTLTFTQDTLVNSVNLTTIDNNIVEETNDLSLALSTSDPAVVLSPSSAGVKITDTSTIRIAFAKPSYSANETTGGVSVCAVVIGKLQRSAIVLVKTSDVTATQTDSVPQQGLQSSYDYLAKNATFIFNETTLQLCVAITFLDDFAYEENETLNVSLSTADPSVVITTPTVGVTIEDSTEIGIGFVTRPNSVPESAGEIRVCIELKNSVVLQAAAAVTFTTAAGSAQPMKNYVSTTSTLTFTQGNRAGCVPVPILDDHVITDTLSFTASLTALSPRELIAPSSTIVTIQNTDRITIGFSTNQYTTPEGSTLQIQVAAQSNAVLLGRPVSVSIRSSDITALASKNYVSVGPLALTFTRDNLVNSVNLTTIDNNIVEGTKELSLALSTSDPAVVLSPSSAGVKITDIDNVAVGPIGPANGGQTVTAEGTNATVCFGITRGNLAKDVSINVRTVDGSAVASKDYTSINIQMAFNVSGSPNPCVVVPLINTTVYKNPTNFTVVITTTDNNLILDTDTVTVVIDNNAELTIGFDPVNYTVVEGTDRSVTLCARVLAGVLGTSITASASTQPGSALGGEDYVGRSGVALQFSPSQLRSCFNVTISDDARVEDTVETFTALLATSAPRVTVQPNVATVIIKDDDYVNITSVDSVLAEEDEAIIDLQLVGVLGKNVTVVLYTVDQTATAPNNYHLTNVTLTFVPNGPTQQSIYIDIVNDMVSRDPLSFVAMVISTDPAVRIVSPRILVTIPNNNTVTIGFTRPLYTVGERDGSVTLCAAVTNGILGRHVSVTMATSDGTALAGSDYQSSTAVLQFGVGETTSCVNVSIVNDQSLETQETFSATLTTGDSRVILNRSTTSVNIVDDDTVTVSFVSPAYYYYTTNTTGYVVVQKTGTSAIPVVVTVTAPSSAQPNPSVGVISSTITFLPGGNAVQNIPFTITDHGIALRSVETHSVALSNPSQGVVLGQPNQTSVVIMDTNMVMVQFEKSTYSVYENNTTGLSVCVVKDKVTAVPVAVTIVSTPITAVEGTNYVSVRTTITMATTSTRQCFTVAVLDNHVALDPDLTFALSLTATPTSVVASTLRSTVTILDSNVVTVKMVQANYSVVEGQSVSVCAVKDLATARGLNVTLNTQSVTAIDGQDFTGGAFVLVFDASPKNTKCVTIVTLPDQIIELPETFEAKLLPASDYLVGNPGTSSVTITEALNVIMANDTVVGDPLFSVPIYIPLSHLFGSIQPALCYEVHGQENVYFNLISDGGVSVNARYLKVNNYLNVIDQVGIRAVDSRGSVLNIRVDLAGCASYINSTATSLYQADGILLRKYSDRVRVSVPNCGRNSVQLVMWVVCQNNELTDPVTGSTVTAAMIKFVVARGLNLSPQSHGIIGQFWNVPVNVSSYTGPLRNGSSNAYPRYTIAVAHPLSPARRFTGILYSYTWEFDEGMCLYVGNRQAGPIYEVESPNDPVIEGAYTDYIMNDAFATDFAYSRFSPKCSL